MLCIFCLFVCVVRVRMSDGAYIFKKIMSLNIGCGPFNATNIKYFSSLSF